VAYIISEYVFVVTPATHRILLYNILYAVYILGIVMDKMAVYGFILAVLRLSVNGAISSMLRTHRGQNGGVRVYSRSTSAFC
jgi:hypothetical protein